MSAYEKPTKNNKKLFVITIIIAAVFLVAVVVTLIFLFSKKTPLAEYEILDSNPTSESASDGETAIAEYEILDSNPTSEQIEKTVDQLQKRAKSLGANISVTFEGEKTLSVKGKEDALTERELTALSSFGELQFMLYSDLKTEDGGTPSEGDKVVYDKSKVLMTGDMIGEASSGNRQQEGSGKTDYGISIKFEGEGIKKFAQITGDHVGEQLAIVFDDKLICAPNLMEEITGGECWISGNFTEESAEQLAAILCTGKLPLELEVRKIY